MEALNSPLLSKPNFFLGVSPFRPIPASTSKYCFTINPCLNRRNRLRVLVKCPVRSSNGENLCISAHFGRASKRRNSLREKLANESPVSISKDFLAADSNLNNQYHVVDQKISFQLNENACDANSASFTGGSEGIGDEFGIIGTSKSIGDSSSWSDLENWVNQNEDDGDANSASFTGGSEGPRDEFGIIGKSNSTGESSSSLSNLGTWVNQYKMSDKYWGSGSKPVKLQGESFLQVGLVILCGWFTFWAIKNFLVGGKNDEVELTREEKEMLRRKMRSRMKREKEMAKVEVLSDDSNLLIQPTERPQIDKRELMEYILKEKVSKEHLTISDFSSNLFENDHNSILEEGKVSEESVAVSDFSTTLSDIDQNFDYKILEIQEMARRARELEKQESLPPKVNDQEVDASAIPHASNGKPQSHDLNMVEKSDFILNSEISQPSATLNDLTMQTNGFEEESDPADLSSAQATVQVSTDIDRFEDVESLKPKQLSSYRKSQQSVPLTDLRTDGFEKKSGPTDLLSAQTSFKVSAGIDRVEDVKPLKANLSWLEENFEELEPIVKKIGIGFKQNYMVAKEKVQEESNLSSDLSQLGSNQDDDELEWMKDEKLRDIVFRVRENELAGREPFHMMEVEDKKAFLKGLEKKVEKENEKLVSLHKWVHSRVENLDYGADGISLDDPPEKIIPRWKGPPIAKDPEFLNNFVNHRKQFFSENLGISQPSDQGAPNSIQKAPEQSSSDGAHKLKQVPLDETSAGPRTIIESSDGSIRAGKKKGKEHWEYTKKWSEEFLQVYNSQTDPEVKSIMKDMGKDLDRWITEKEVQEAADLMSQISKKRRKYIDKKMAKLKREMEMFGPQAVVSKYREYSEEKEEDYLWWLDLPFVLCIELYRIEDGDQKVGFYSLEMAQELEVEPTPCHVIAFEDPTDAKNLCYIIQAHLEMLGHGSAFVVSRPPKDAFREAKANGFNVTVIRKGELQLNVDQTLEEVEIEINEIGSKLYHDLIMRERSVDMGSLMKGVFASGKSTKRRPKRMLKSLPNTE